MYDYLPTHLICSSTCENLMTQLESETLQPGDLDIRILLLAVSSTLFWKGGKEILLKHFHSK